jgi:hypothetical protein
MIRRAKGVNAPLEHLSVIEWVAPIISMGYGRGRGDLARQCAVRFLKYEWHDVLRPVLDDMIIISHRAVHRGKIIVS